MEIQIQNKLKVLFSKIVEPGYVMNTYYTDNLIIKFSSSNDPDVSILESMPLISDLIVEAVNKTVGAHDSVKVFLTRMVAVACKSELNCLKLFCKNNILDTVFSEINSPNLSPSLTVAYIEVALAMIQHNSCVVKLLESGIWKQILSFSNNQKTVFILRKAYAFASKFVWKLNDIGDEQNLRLVLSNILKPLIDIDFLALNSVSSEAEEEMLKTVKPVLYILMTIATESNCILTPSMLIQILVKEYKMCSLTVVMVERIRNEEVILLLCKLGFIFVVGKVRDIVSRGQCNEKNNEKCTEITVNFYNTITFLIQRRAASLILDYCYGCYDIWSLLWAKSDPDWKRNGKQVDMRRIILLICLVPTIHFIFNLKKENTDEDTLFDEYVIKFVSSTCEHTVKACYAYKDLVSDSDSISMTLQSIKRLSHLKNDLNGYAANLVFQALFHVLRQNQLKYETSTNKEEDFDQAEDNNTIITYVLDAVLQIVKHHDINWQESIEVICLYSVVHATLERPNLSCKFKMTALNVITVAIKKFLPPNLSLLMESQPGSLIHEIGKLMHTMMHDMNWEVRDSALELLHVCTEISFIKFQPMQKQISENNLINVAATMAMHDHESYVQVSALKCVAAATKITHIWDQLTQQYPDIQNKLILILRNNDEGIVRKEAGNVLCEIYQNVKTSPEFKQTLYEHMVSSALADFHWEVQLVSLRFWKIVIQQLLTDQGMLDGSFPPVTFSRESRKIVTLNEAEIQRRLLKVLQELSSIGCLTVLIKLLHEDIEVDIMDAALSLSLELLETLKMYKMVDNFHERQSDLKVEELISENVADGIIMEGIEVRSPEIPAQENVIEGILNADDINLLANIYSSHLNINYERPAETSKPKIKQLKQASPQFFVTFLNSKDYKEIIQQKKTWKKGIRSLSSLMDDVLGIYEMNEEVNSADCY